MERDLRAADIALFAIGRRGSLPRDIGPLPDEAAEALAAMSGLYEVSGFTKPWIGYVAVAETVPVGICGFKSPPENGRVEIAYFTFPKFEGRGVATLMAAKLAVLASTADPDVVIAAQTLPTRGPSHRILEKLGFRHVETVDHADDGSVFEWHLER